MSVVVRKIMKYHWYKLRYSVDTVTLRMCCYSKYVCQVAVVSDFVLSSSVKIILVGSLNFFLLHIHRMSFSSFSKNICATSSSSLFAVSHQFPLINSFVKAFYVVAKRAGNMFLVLFRITMFRIRLTGVYWFGDRFKICVYYKGNSHRIIQVITL